MEEVKNLGRGHIRYSKGKQTFVLWFRGKATKEANDGVQRAEPKFGVEFLGPNS